MAELTKTDLCIVGAGALGRTLACHARQLDASVVLVDRGPVEPGDGPDQTMRLAALQAIGARAHAARQGGRYGLATGDPKPSLKAIQERLRDLVALRQPVDSVDRLGALGIEVLTGVPRFTDARTLSVGEHQVRAGTVVLALGAARELPAVPGLDEIEIFTPDSILEAQRKLSHLLVVGGDASAYALAQVFRRLGSTVTLVPQGPILPGFDPETAAILVEALEGEGVTIVAGGVLSAIQPRPQGTGAAVTLASGETLALDVSHVLVATGGSADLASLGLDAARLRVKRGGADFLWGSLGETSNRRVRLVGSAAGIEQWQHALVHGKAVIENIILGAPRHRPGPQPRLVLTEPALAQVGRLPGDKDRTPHTIRRASFSENERALASDEGRGLAKAYVAPNGVVSGASIVGPAAAEMAAVLAIAMARGIPLDALSALSLPNPSFFAILTALGENQSAHKSVTPWTAPGRVLRRINPF